MSSKSSSSSSRSGGRREEGGKEGKTREEDKESEKENDDDDDEKKYSTGAPLRRIDMQSYLDYKEIILNDIYHHYYVTTDWSPMFYRILATDGFISVAQEHYLIPEIQTYYCILDFPNLHKPKKMKKILNRYVHPYSHGGITLTSTTSNIEGNNTSNSSSSVGVTDSLIAPLTVNIDQQKHRLRLFVNRNTALCITKLQKYWDDSNWLSDKYIECLTSSGLAVYTIELYLEMYESSGVVSHTLLAGEIGYTIGSVYTSLTGFHMGGSVSAAKKRDEKKKKNQNEENNDGDKLSNQDKIENDEIHATDVLMKDMYLESSSLSLIPFENVSAEVASRRYFTLPKDLARCCGTIQLTALGTWLSTSGFSFWNLGHPPRKVAMKYKKDLGGLVYPRKQFLSRWNKATADHNALFLSTVPCRPLDRQEIISTAVKQQEDTVYQEFDLNLMLSCKE